MNCGATVRGYYQGLDLGTVDIATAIEQGLDYYLLLGVKPDASDATIQATYRRISMRFPENRSRVAPQVAQRLLLIEQAGYVLCDPQRRQTYEQLRRARQQRQAPRQDAATRGMICFRTGRFNDAARLLRSAARQSPDNPQLHLYYSLSLLYGCANLASPEDWRVDEMLHAMEQALQQDDPDDTISQHRKLYQAINHYDQGRSAQGWEMLTRLTQTFPDWHLPWTISAYWCRREGNMGEMLARAERARRLHPDDQLLASLTALIHTIWSSMPAALPDAAQRAAHVLADGTPASSLEATWRQT